LEGRSIGVKAVGELFGVMRAANADHGVALTYGGFTSEACEFGKANSNALIARPKLIQMIASVPESGNMQPKLDAADEACPKSGSQIVLRETRKGPHAVKKFYGCSKYPGCRGVVSQAG
jgi:restriction system protein